MVCMHVSRRCWNLLLTEPTVAAEKTNPIVMNQKAEPAEMMQTGEPNVMGKMEHAFMGKTEPAVIIQKTMGLA